MAIQQRNVNNSLTEIYVGGGNCITQAYPTNFHTFWQQKILTARENISDFKEVTPSQVAALEAADAAWEPWSDELIAQFDAACGTYGGYNRTTGFGELNGLKDITASQAREILTLLNYDATVERTGKFAGSDVRTMTLRAANQYISISIANLFYYADKLETVRFTSRDGIFKLKGPSDFAFAFCNKLTTIFGVVDFSNGGDPYTINLFTNCYNLENFTFKGISKNFNLSQSPKVSLASLQYLVEHAANTAPITITLHADAYARLTDELMAAAAAKQITFATPT